VAPKLTVDPILHKRTKHLEVDSHFTQDKVQEGVIETRGIGITKQSLDIFIKTLSETTRISIEKVRCLGHLQTTNLKGSVGRLARARRNPFRLRLIH